MRSLRLVASEPHAHEHDLEHNCEAALEALSPLFDSVSPFEALGSVSMGSLLRDLSFAVVAAAAGEQLRSVVPTEAATTRGAKRSSWEVGVERDGGELLVSVFTRGASPDVAQTERSVSLDGARKALLGAIEAWAESSDGAHRVLEPGLELAHDQLERSAGSDSEAPPSKRQHVCISSAPQTQLSLSAELWLRRRPREPGSEVLRADLQSLLFLGNVTVGVGDSQRTLEAVHVFLLAEQLVGLAERAMSASAEGRGMLRKVVAAGVSCGVQLDAEGAATILIHGPAAHPSWRFAPVPLVDLAGAVLSFGRALVQRILQADGSQSRNLRLAGLREQLSGLGSRIESKSDEGSKLNRAPESYRAYAQSDSRPPPPVAPGRLGRLRFSETWRAVVPGIDLRSVMLCGDVLLVGSSRELACIERSAGELVWSRPAPRAVSLLTPAGLVRLQADGHLTLHDVRDGEPLVELRLGPSVGASTTGAIINAPGLPRMLLLAEGAGSLVAVDLDSGEVRWRREQPRNGPLRLRRAGKLLIAAAGGAELSALDLLSGETVWRHRGQQFYNHAPLVHAGELYVTSDERSTGPCPSRLERIDPWTGAVQWQSPLPRVARLCGAPARGRDTVLVVAREGERSGVVGFDAADGSLRFDAPDALAPGEVAWLSVDDRLIANSEHGELVALDTRDGSIAYRHVFANYSGRSSLHPGDRPQSLQPVLRSGALFVPQCEVYVVRPHDGVVVGRVPTDLVPDRLRVDERCGVYVAEMSGHLAAYASLPRLTLLTEV